MTVTLDVVGSEDVTVLPSSLEFRPGRWDTAQTVTVSALEDDDGALDVATIEQAVSGGDYGSETAPDVAVTVTENETASTAVTLTVNPGSVDEDAGATTVTVTAELDASVRAADTVVTVSVGANRDSAEEGTDYQLVSDFTVTIPAGSTSASETFLLTPENDAVAEGNEQLSIKGSVSGLDVIGAAVTIADDEGPLMVTVESDGPVAEGEAATFTVRLSAELPDTLRMAVSARAGTAGPPEDYAPLSDVLVFSPGVTERTVSVQTAEDTLVEGEERFSVVVEFVPGSLIPARPVSAEGVIEDDDALEASVVADSARVSEGGTARFTVELTGGTSTAAVEVTYTVGGTAVSGEDYLAAPGSLTIGAGDAAGAIEIETIDDSIAETDETVLITLTGASTVGAATADAGTAETTIEDDDVRGVEVSPTTLAIPEGRSASYTVVLRSSPTDTVTVTVRGTSGTDVSVDHPTLEFTTENWAAAQAVTVSAVEDADAGNDTVTLTHTASGGGYDSAVIDSVEVTVLDISVTVTPTSLNVDEGDTVIYAVTLGVALPENVLLTIGGYQGTDVGAVPLFLVGNVLTVAVTAAHDANGADDRVTLTHTASGGGYHVVGESLPVLVVDDDRGVTVMPASLTVSEGGAATYTVVLDARPAGDVTVTVGGTSGTDVSVDHPTLEFTRTNWATAQVVTVSAVADADAVNDAVTLTHTASGGDYDSTVIDSVEVTVDDDETASTAVTLTAVPDSVDEDAGSTTVTVTAELDASARAVDTVVTVSVGASSDSAVKGTDYQLVSDFTVTIAADSTSGSETFLLTPENDALDEESETMSVTGSVAGLTVTDASVTIEDDDTRGVEVSPTSVTVPEGGSASYTVVLRSSPTGPVTVALDVVGSPDVTVLPSSLEFTSLTWETAQTVTVSALEDGDGALDEATIGHTVSGGDYGSETAPDVAVTVTENEERLELRASLSPVTQSVEEGETAEVTVRIEATRLPAIAVSFRASTQDGTASSSDDYTPLVPRFEEALRSEFVDQGGGSYRYERTFELQTVDDAADEEGEWFFFDITAPVDPDETDYSSEVLGDPDGARIEIADNDTRGVEVSPTTLAVPEGGSASYTVVLKSRPTGRVTVTLDVVGSEDVSVLPSSLEFRPGRWDTAQTVTVSALEDDDGALDVATIEQTVSGGDYGSETASDVAVTVTENDTASTAVTLTAAPDSVDEDAGPTTVTVTAELDASARAVDTVVTVSVGASGDSAVEGTDYQLVSDFTVTIPADSTSGSETFVLTPENDAVAEGNEELSIEGSVSGLNVIDAAVRIADDDTASTAVTLTAVPDSVDEDAGPTTVTVTAELDASVRAVDTVVTVSVGAGGDSAVEGTDYQLVSDFTVTIAADSTSGSETFVLTPENDAVAEGNEELSIEGSVSGLDVIGAAADGSRTTTRRRRQ